MNQPMLSMTPPQDDQVRHARCGGPRAIEQGDVGRSERKARQAAARNQSHQQATDRQDKDHDGHEGQIAPTNQYVKQWPLGREPSFKVSEYLRVRIWGDGTRKAYTYVVIEI